MGWIQTFFISGKTTFGILPVGCPNCHKSIELGDKIFSFGYYRHKECHKLILEVRKTLGIDVLLEEVG